MSDEEILESDSLLKTALAIALEDVPRLTRERDEALLIKLALLPRGEGR